jgi:metal-responsive CopG/Arc/MetJ family transcriptional regulator
MDIYMDMLRKRVFVKALVTLPSKLIEKLDALGDEVGINRSQVISDICEFVLDDEDIIDEIYPREEED